MLLVVTHSRSGTTRQLAESVIGGALEASGIDGLEVVERDAFDAGPDDVVGAGAVILGTPARFGYMSGAMKDFLERIYEPCMGRTAAMPWALFVKGDTDVEGCISSVERIVAGLRWRRVLPVLAVVGEIEGSHMAAARELGASMAAGLELDIF